MSNCPDCKQSILSQTSTIIGNAKCNPICPEEVTCLEGSIPSSCVYYSGQTLPCTGVLYGNTISQAIQALSNEMFTITTTTLDIQYSTSSAGCKIVSINNLGCQELVWNDIGIEGDFIYPVEFDGQSLQVPQYAKNECTQQVYLRGTFALPEGADDPGIAALFTLPVGFRPINTRFYPYQLSPASGFDTTNSSPFITIAPNGDVIPAEVAGATANTFLIYCLDGIFFETN
jgi:hypothetical protein